MAVGIGRWSRWVGAFATVFLAAATSHAASDSMRGSAGAQGARWLDSVITLNFEPTMDAFGDAAFEALVQGVSAWQSLPLPLPTMIVDRGDNHDLGYRPKSSNYNSVRYAIDGDPMARGALAITIITFDTDAKRILDADIVMNGEHHFEIITPELDVTDSTYDLQNVLTHELGHLLGLGEDYDHKDATMYAYSLPKEIAKRDLEEPDKSSIAALYDGPPPQPDALVGCGTTVHRRGANDHAWLWSILGLGVVACAARRRAWRSATVYSLSTLAMFCAIRFDSNLTQHQATLFGETLVRGEAPHAAPTAFATVLESRSRWEQGLVVTTLHLDRPVCSGGGEVCSEPTVDVLGGRVGPIEQIVGRALPPPVGGRVALEETWGEVKAPLVRAPNGELFALHVLDRAAEDPAAQMEADVEQR